jgi:type I restriction enzyme M protein
VPAQSARFGDGDRVDNKIANQAKTLANFVWQIAEILRGDFKQSEYGKIILPFVVLRRLDCILEPTKNSVLVASASLPKGIDEQTRDMMLYAAIGGGIRVYNTSPLTFAKIRSQNPADAHKNLVAYITAFSDSVRDVFLDKFLFTDQLKRLNEAAILWKVFEQLLQSMNSEQSRILRMRLRPCPRL